MRGFVFLFVFLTNAMLSVRAAAPQFAGEQPHAGQSGGGAWHAGVRHHQRQNQAAGRPPDQDSGRLVGVYVPRTIDPCGVKQEGKASLLNLSVQNVQI